MNQHIPIILAVTGHKNLSSDSVETDREKIELVLKYFLDTYPNTPLYILSTLTEGTESLFADVALDLRDNTKYKYKAGIKVIAPLPLDKELYLKDFSTTERKEKLEALLNRCDEHFVLAPYKGTEQPLSQGDANFRNAQYANLGAFLVHHCNVLVALWDGDTSSKDEDRTHHLVNMMLNSGMDWGVDIDPNIDFKSKSLLDGGEPGVVIHIPVVQKNIKPKIDKKLKNQQPKHHDNWVKNTSLNDVNWYYSRHSTEKNKSINDNIIKMQRINFSSSLDKTECMNALIGKYPQNSPWLGDLERLSSPINSLSQSIFNACDTLALKLQQKVNRYIILFFIALVATVSGYEIFSEFGSNKDLIADVSLGIFSFGVFVVSLLLWVVRKYKTKNNFHDARALAEAMRVTYFLLHARLYKQFTRTYHFDNQGEAAWLENTRKMVTLKCWANTDKDEETSRTHVEDVLKAWVDDQESYLGKKLAKLKKTESRIKRIRESLYLFTVIGLAVLVGYYTVVDSNAQNYVWAVGAVLALVAIIAEWQSVIGYKEDINRYEKALYMFRRAKLEIEEKLGEDEVKEASNSLVQLAYEALKENLKWYQTHIGKQISAPK